MSILDKSRALTDRLNREASQRGDVGPSHRELVASDEYGRSLSISPSGSACYPWSLVIRPTIGAAHVSQHASIEAAQRRAAEHLGRSRLMTGWTWIWESA